MNRFKKQLAAAVLLALLLALLPIAASGESDGSVCSASGGAHVFGEWQMAAPASCTAAGAQKRSCSACGYEQTEEIPPLGHQWVHILVPPENGLVGIEFDECCRCKQTKNEVILPTDWNPAPEEPTTEMLTAPLEPATGAPDGSSGTTPAPVPVDPPTEPLPTAPPLPPPPPTPSFPPTAPTAATEPIAPEPTAPKPAIRVGDVDGDGSITSADARLALRAAVKLDVLRETAQKAADVDNDEKITTSDARKILRAAVSLDALPARRA